jgi:hypothetical protein
MATAGTPASWRTSLLKEVTGKIFTSGQNSLGSGGEARTAYIKALQAADGGDYGPLLFFLGITSG